MIDSRDHVIDLLERHSDVLSEFSRGILNAVAQSYRADFGCLIQSPAIHRHGIGVVEVDDSGAKPLHLFAHVDQDGNGPNRPHDSANP